MARWVRLIDTAPASKLYLTHVQLCTTKGDVVKLLANLFCSGFFSFFDPVSSARQTYPELPLSLADDSNFLLVLEQSQRLESAQLATALVQGEAGRVQLLTHGRLNLNLDVWDYLVSCIARDRDLLRTCYPESVWLSIRKSLENVLEKSDESRFSFQLMFYNTTLQNRAHDFEASIIEPSFGGLAARHSCFPLVEPAHESAGPSANRAHTTTSTCASAPTEQAAAQPAAVSLTPDSLPAYEPYQASRSTSGASASAPSPTAAPMAAPEALPPAAASRTSAPPPTAAPKATSGASPAPAAHSACPPAARAPPPSVQDQAFVQLSSVLQSINESLRSASQAQVELHNQVASTQQRMEGEMRELRAAIRESPVRQPSFSDTPAPSIQKESSVASLHPSGAAAAAPQPAAEISIGMPPFRADPGRQAAPKPAWMFATTVPGLEASVEPDCGTAWGERPRTNAYDPQTKTRYASMSKTYGSAALLDGLPDLGDAAAYREVRHHLLHGFYINRYVLNGGPEEDVYADRALLTALQKCAAKLGTQAPEQSTNRARLQALSRAGTLVAFVHGLDSLFMDSSGNITEKQWQAIGVAKGKALDMFHRLRPLLGEPVILSSCQRAKQLLIRRLASQNDVHTMNNLSACRDDDVDAWLQVLQTADGNLRIIAEETKGVDMPPIIRAPASRPRQVVGVMEGEPNPSIEQLVATMNHHVVSRAAMVGLPVKPEYPEKGPITLDASQDYHIRDPVLKDISLQVLGAFQQQEYKPIWDLEKVYPHLGYSKSDVPPPTPGLSSENGVCKICEFLGKLQHVKYTATCNKPSMLPEGAVFAHQPWKCKHCPAAVKKQAESKGTSAAEVARLLTPLPIPPWKS